MKTALMMPVRIVALISLLLLLTGSSNAQNTTGIDVSHYRFNLTISDQSDTVYATASISLKLVKNTNSFSLDLGNIDSSGKGMKVIAVREEEKNLLFHHHNNKLLVRLPVEAKAGDTLAVIIQYRGIPADGLIIGKNLFNKRTFFADNWPNRAHYWLPCNDIPADKASLEFVITAPKHYDIISNGIKTEEQVITDSTKLTHWREDVPLPTKVMVFGAADFRISEVAYAGDIPVTSWVFADQKGFHDYVLASEILQFYINYIGPYGYKKLANVQSKTRFGGMENAGAIFYFEGSVQGKGALEELLAHEIAHQWFGDMVTETDFKHVWLSEGFATYMTGLYTESKYGSDSLRKKMNDERNSVIDFAARSRSAVIDTSGNLMKLLNANSYQKGAWILHMLRNRVGDDVFQKIIREYYGKFAGKNASSEDFIAVAEMVSNKNLRSFFTQWLYKPGHPVLATGWNVSSSGKKLVITVEQKQDGLFSFPIDMLIKTANGDLVKTVTIKKRRTRIKVAVRSAVTKIITDHNCKLLYQEYTIKKD